MRNLKLQYCNIVANTVADTQFVLLDPNTCRNSDLVYVTTAKELYSCGITSGRTEKLLEAPGIVGAEYLALSNDICLATEQGEVLIINPQTREVTEGTYCDVGILCMAWSPDQEAVVFVTKTRNVVVMTCTYDPIAEHPLDMQCDGDEQFVNVGWGRKATQFHGSEGKKAASRDTDFKIPENTKDLPQRIEVTWRADGAYFAISFVSDQVGRMFKVFDKEGKLNYTSERLNDLHTSIAWRPSGNWIAVPERLPNKSIIVLFEKNGLRHRDIELPFRFDDEYINSFKWSPDSDILTIETRHITTKCNNLYLYTINNYHWYLKQTLSFDADQTIAVYNWDNRIDEEKTLHVILSNGKYIIYRWHFFIDKFEQSGVVAVIDARKLLITDFSNTIIPPPMSSKELNLDVYINACTFASDDKSGLHLCICDMTQTLHLYKSLLCTPTQIEKVCTLRPDTLLINVPLELGNMFLLDEQHLVASSCNGTNSKIHLITLDYEAGIYKSKSILPISGIVNVLCSGSVELEQFFAQTLDGKVQQISVKADYSLRLEELYTQMEQPADHLQWYSSCDLNSSGLISLKHNQCLQIDDQRIASDVTSFCLADNYLAYTKLNALYFLRLRDRANVDERKIERGGKLVTTVFNKARTVLQMPRGNLETICPRVLSLELVGALLERMRYNAAMEVLRRERINLNIMCDHDMKTFVSNLDTFLREIQNSQWLNLFLSDLQNEDFTTTMYTCNYEAGSQNYPEDFTVERKVAYLCREMTTRMEELKEPRFRLPIITAYVKLGKMEQALKLIWEQKKSQHGEESKNADDSLKYLLYLVDVNELYNVALGTYDFGLVLFVAQKSQKDPKEFLAFLNELKTLEVNYRMFKIDEHLKRYEKALQHIAACGVEKFEEALSFIKRHGLYHCALISYKAEPKCYQQICLAFGDHLRAMGKLENASIMYERGGNYTQAILSAKHVLDWQRVLALTYLEGQNEQVVALSLVDTLQDHGQHETAFYLLKTYGNNFVDALQCLVKGKLFLRAIFEARTYVKNDNRKDQDIIGLKILPDLIKYCRLLTENFQADSSLYMNYKQRLLAIRERKAKQHQEDNGDEGNFDECDLLSDTTSMRSSHYTSSSRGTGKTFRSSKNRRKHERKLLSLKPGNPFEDIALIDALHNHITKITDQQQVVRDTCKALLEVREDNMATTLQKIFKQLLAQVQDSLSQIWIPELLTTEPYLTGPNIDYTALQNEQRYAMIDPRKRLTPSLNIIDWEHEILK